QPTQVPYLLSLDLAREALVLAGAYLEVELAGAPDVEARKRITDQLKADQKAIEERLRVERGRYEQQAEVAGRLRNRYALARRRGDGGARGRDARGRPDAGRVGEAEVRPPAVRGAEGELAGGPDARGVVAAGGARPVRGRVAATGEVPGHPRRAAAADGAGRR